LTVYLMRSAMSTISSRSFTSGTNLRNCTYPGYSITFLKLCRIYLILFEIKLFHPSSKNKIQHLWKHECVLNIYFEIGIYCRK
jgi:hypothetical protein